MRQLTAPVRRGARIFRDFILRGSDQLITSVEGTFTIPVPASLRGRERLDFIAFSEWLDGTIRKLCARAEADAARRAAESAALENNPMDGTGG